MTSHPEQPAQANATGTGAEKVEAATTKRVDELSGLARSAWFSLLGALAFAAVTLLSVEHSDLLLDNRMIQLPIVNIPVPTRLFLTLGPVVLAVLYVHLHLYLIKLWHAFRYAPTDRPAADPPDESRPGWRLADHIQPWLVNDYALTLKHGTNPRDRGRSFLRNRITLFTVWSATPFVLAWMWCKSLLVREAWITLPILACLAVVLLIGSHSWLEARRQLAAPDRTGPRRLRNLASLLTAVLILLAGYATWAAFWPRYPAAYPGTAYLQRPLDVDRQDIAEIGGSLAPLAFQREEYRQSWCRLVDVPLDLCAKPPGATDILTNSLIVARQRHCRETEVVHGLKTYRKCNAYFADLDRRFEEDWLGVRRQALAKVTRLALGDMRLSGMSAESANLTRANLEHSDLSWAAMPRVTLEGATLVGANLENAIAYGSNLGLANLTGAALPHANLESAVLAGAAFVGADLTDANLRGADLTDANLVGADLTGADLRWSKLTHASLSGAILTDARLGGAIGLTQRQLDDAVGSKRTEFSVSNTLDDEGDFPDRPLTVPDCLDLAVAALADRFDRLEPYRCAAGSAPQWVGRSDGRPRVAPEGNVDRRAPQVPVWPPGLERGWPDIALHWKDSKDEVLP